MERLQQLLGMEADRDRWYDRVVAAEYQLAKLRTALHKSGLFSDEI